MTVKKSFLNVLLAATALAFSAPAFAGGGLAGSLNDLFSDSGSSSSSNSSTDDQPQPAPAPEPAPPPPPPAPAEFYPGAEAVYTTTDPLVGDSRGLVRMPDGSMKFVEKDVNGNVVSETPVPPEDAEMFKPTEPGGTVDLDRLPDGTWEVRQYDQDGNLVGVEPLSGQKKEETPESAPAPSPRNEPRELPSASMTDPATGITTTSQGNPDGSRTVTKTDKDGNVLSREVMPPRGQGLPSASAYDPKTGITTTAQGNPDGSHTITKTRDSEPRGISAERGASGGDTRSDAAGREGEFSRLNDEASQAVDAPRPAPMPIVDGPLDPGAPRPAPMPVVDGPVDPDAPRPATITPENAASESERHAGPPDGPLGADAPETPRESVLDEIEASEAQAAAERPLTPTQAGRNLEAGARDGRLDANPADWERDAAAGLSAAFGADSPEEAAALAERNRAHQDAMTQPRRDAEASAELERRLQDARVRAEAEAARERKENADRESLNRRRERAVEDLRRYEESLDQKLARENRTQLNAEEFLEQQRREARMTELMALTPEEEAEVERQGNIHYEVAQTIEANARNYGLRSEEETAERLQNERMSDAATRGWRDYTFTGRMVSETRDDIFRQREQGIVNNSQVEAAQNYLRRRDITDDQRRAAERYLAMAVTQRGHNAEAILYDGAVVTLGAASDVATLAAGGTISRGVSKVAGYFKGAPPPAVPPPARPPVANPPPVPPGQVPSGVSQAASEGTTIITNAGRAAGQGADEATTIINRSATKPLNQMTRAELQAYNDALAKQAVANRANLTESQILGRDVLPRPPLSSGPAGQAASGTGQLSRNLTQNQIDDLFRPGANLTRDQLLQKTDAILSGRVHPAYRPPTPPGTVPQGAGDATTRLFPGRSATQAAEETGTLLNPGRAPAANPPSFRSAPTEALPSTSTPTVLNPGRAPSQALDEVGTIIERQ